VLQSASITTDRGMKSPTNWKKFLPNPLPNLRENVEIEIDEENILLKTTQASNHENPLLAALYRAAALQDGISAIRIAGEEPSLDHHTELRTALKTLRDALNSDLKD
jgi:hypothetical protein